MSLTPLNAISPIDGRQRSKTNELADYFSEAGLIKYRVLIEIEYFIALCTIPVPQLSDFDSNLFENLRIIYKKFSFEDAKAIKEIENVTNHDVKAVEYFIKQKFDALNLDPRISFYFIRLNCIKISNKTFMAKNLSLPVTSCWLTSSNSSPVFKGIEHVDAGD